MSKSFRKNPVKIRTERSPCDRDDRAPCNVQTLCFLYRFTHIVYGTSRRGEGGYLAKGEIWHKCHNSQLQFRIATTRNWRYSLAFAENVHQASAVFFRAMNEGWVRCFLPYTAGSDFLSLYNFFVFKVWLELHMILRHP